MTDGYEYYCFEQLAQGANAPSTVNDEVVCACAKYLIDEGYGTVSYPIKQTY